MRLGLGGLWIWSGLLQAQPGMFAMDMISTTMQASATAEPGWLAGLIRWSIRMVTPRLVAFNWCVIVLEIGLGLLLLGVWSRGVRPALWLSMVWALAVWVFGEGMGQLLTRSATFLAGAPGAMLLYGVGAALLLLPAKRWSPRSGLPSLPTLVVLGALVLGGFLQLAPVFWTALGLANPLGEGLMMPQPVLLRSTVNAGVALAFAVPVAFNAALVLTMLGLACLLFLWPRDRLVFWAAVIFLALTWVVGEDMGMLFGGMATDPNSAPILTLLLVSGCTDVGTAHARPAAWLKWHQAPPRTGR